MQSSVILNDFALSVQCKVIAYISLLFLFLESVPALISILFMRVCAHVRQLASVCALVAHLFVSTGAYFVAVDVKVGEVFFFFRRSICRNGHDNLLTDN